MVYVIPDFSWLTSKDPIGILVESACWGFNTCLLILCLWIFKYRPRRLNTGVLTGVIIMYILATIHYISGIVDIWFGPINFNIVFLRMSIYAVNNSLADAVVVWRCLVVWQRDRRACALPILLLIATTVSGLYFAALFKDYRVDDPAYAQRVLSDGIAFFPLSLATNTITTLLVAGRIWWLAHQVFTPGLSTGRYNAVVAMLVESGLSYSMIKVVELVLWSLTSPSALIALNNMPQIMCITTMAIFVIVALGIVDSGVPQPTEDLRRSFSGRGAAITGASFQFARPTLTTTFGRSDTVGSGVGVSFPLPVKRDDAVDFRTSGCHTAVVATLPEERGLGDLSEKSSYDEMCDRNASSDDDLEKQVKLPYKPRLTTVKAVARDRYTSLFRGYLERPRATRMY